jgi:hypothetical protein
MKHVLLTVVAMGIAAAALPAAAAPVCIIHEPQRVFHTGAECRHVNHQTGAPATGEVTAEASFLNPEADYTDFVCPLDQAELHHPIDKVGKVGIYALDDNADVNMWCTVQSVDPFGLTATSTAAKFTTGMGLPTQLLEWSYGDMSGLLGNQHWFIRCSVPGYDRTTFNLSGVSGYYFDDTECWGWQ